ncbi:CRISPR system precrRNA processing endoribonuclease RAMP protein Cas6 [Streptomyces sp. NPDC002742]|uniref:CRISPR system precrRNA processing endoribonuclease RAMP protein Cas6 n=1 Tax=Streptomyces sp. NPDC002742 TaxID=3364663 RepID=UPI0036756267
MPTTWTLRLHHPSPSPYPVTPVQLNGLACTLTEHPDSDHTAQTKPFSVSPLFQDNSTTDHRILRIGWLDDGNPLDLTHLPGQRIRLGHNILTTTDIRREHTPYASLLSHPPAARARFTFHSATYFKSSGKWIPVPDPQLLFPGLLRRWNTYAPVPISHEQTDGLLPSIAIAEHDIRTVPVAFPHSHRTGFIGTATFTLTGSAPITATRVFPALCHLAATAGTGAQTTHGLGHTQVHLHPTAHPVTAPTAARPETPIPARHVPARQPRRSSGM